MRSLSLRWNATPPFRNPRDPRQEQSSKRELPAQTCRAEPQQILVAIYRFRSKYEGVNNCNFREYNILYFCRTSPSIEC
jgi:hypothetical protein